MTHRTLRNAGITSITALSLALVACGGSSSSSTPPAPANNAPRITGYSAPAGLLNNGAPISLHTYAITVSATDADNDAIKFSLGSGSAAGATISESGVITFKPTAAGAQTINVIATDSKGAASSAFSVVLNVVENAKPGFSAPPALALNAGEIRTVVVGNEKDSDGDVVTYTADLTGCAFATFDAASRTVALKPASNVEPKDYTIKLTAKDAVGAESTMNLVLSVNQAANHAPAIVAGLGNQLDNQGAAPIYNTVTNREFAYPFQASDVDPWDTGKLVWSVEEITPAGAPPSGAKMVGGNFSWTPSVTMVGYTYTFTVKVTDTKGAFDARVFLLNAIQDKAPVFNVAAALPHLPSLTLNLGGIGGDLASEFKLAVMNDLVNKVNPWSFTIPQPATIPGVPIAPNGEPIDTVKYKIREVYINHPFVGGSAGDNTVLASYATTYASIGGTVMPTLTQDDAAKTLTFKWTAPTGAEAANVYAQSFGAQGTASFNTLATTDSYGYGTGTWPAWNADQAGTLYVVVDAENRSGRLATSPMVLRLNVRNNQAPAFGTQFTAPAYRLADGVTAYVPGTGSKVLNDLASTGLNTFPYVDKLISPTILDPLPPSNPSVVAGLGLVIKLNKRASNSAVSIWEPDYDKFKVELVSGPTGMTQATGKTVEYGTATTTVNLNWTPTQRSATPVTFGLKATDIFGMENTKSYPGAFYVAGSVHHVEAHGTLSTYNVFDRMFGAGWATRTQGLFFFDETVTGFPIYSGATAAYAGVPNTVNQGFTLAQPNPASTTLAQLGYFAGTGSNTAIVPGGFYMAQIYSRYTDLWPKVPTGINPDSNNVAKVLGATLGVTGSPAFTAPVQTWPATGAAAAAAIPVQETMRFYFTSVDRLDTSHSVSGHFNTNAAGWNATPSTAVPAAAGLTINLGVGAGAGNLSRAWSPTDAIQIRGGYNTYNLQPQGTGAQALQVWQKHPVRMDSGTPAHLTAAPGAGTSVVMVTNAALGVPGFDIASGGGAGEQLVVTHMLQDQQTVAGVNFPYWASGNHFIGMAAYGNVTGTTFNSTSDYFLPGFINTWKPAVKRSAFRATFPAAASYLDDTLALQDFTAAGTSRPQTFVQLQSFRTASQATFGSATGAALDVTFPTAITFRDAFNNTDAASALYARVYEYSAGWLLGVAGNNTLPLYNRQIEKVDASTKDSEIVPLVTPVSNISLIRTADATMTPRDLSAVDGNDFTNRLVTTAGATPIITWSAAPAATSGYQVFLYSLNAGNIITTPVATFVTKETRLPIPPGLLSNNATISYLVVVRAVAMPGVDFSTKPEAKALPMAYADAVSRPFSY